MTTLKFSKIGHTTVWDCQDESINSLMSEPMPGSWVIRFLFPLHVCYFC